MAINPFYVKQYNPGDRPTVKGNGFDGIEVGETREEAEEFIIFVNHLVARVTGAEKLIARAVEIMTPEQVGRWEGVRAWQEEESP